MGNIIHYDYYCKIKEKLIDYIQYKEIIHKLKKNLISNQSLVDCGLTSNIFKAKDFRRYITSVQDVESIANKIIFLKFDSRHIAWENKFGDIVVFVDINPKARWSKFKNFTKYGTDKCKCRTLETRKYHKRDMETRRKMH